MGQTGAKPVDSPAMGAIFRPFRIASGAKRSRTLIFLWKF
jgi:hypothetical protein